MGDIIDEMFGPQDAGRQAVDDIFGPASVARQRRSAQVGAALGLGGGQPRGPISHAEQVAQPRTRGQQTLDARRAAIQDEARQSNRRSFGESLTVGLNQAGGMFAGAIEAVGEVTGSDGLAAFGRAGREGYEDGARQFEATRAGKQKFAEIETVDDAVAWVRETTGEQIPMLGAALTGAVIGGPLGAFAASATMGTGEVQGNLKQKDPAATAGWGVFVGGSAIGALDSILPAKIGSQMVRSLGRRTAEEVALRALLRPTRSVVGAAARGAGKGMLVEGLTESLQEAIGEVGASFDARQDIDWNALPEQMVEAGAAGALMGFGAGGSAGAIEGAQDGREARDRAIFDGIQANALATRGMDPNGYDPRDPIMPLRARAPAPAGVREAAALGATLTPEDQDSALPDDLIAAGKSEIAAATATGDADRILAELGLPKVGTKVKLSQGGRTLEGTVSDAFQIEAGGVTAGGVKITHADGSVTEELADTLRDMGVTLAPALPASDLADPVVQEIEAAPRPTLPERMADGGAPPAASEVDKPTATARDQVKSLIRRAESSGDDRAENPRSSASGRYQFIRSTWESLGGDWSRRFDPVEQERLMDRLLDQNEAALRRAGAAVDAGTLYLAHFLGAGGAAAALRNPDAPVDAAVQGANPFAKGWTNRRLAAWAAEEMGGSASALPASNSRIATDAATEIDRLEQTPGQTGADPAGPGITEPLPTAFSSVDGDVFEQFGHKKNADRVRRTLGDIARFVRENPEAAEALRDNLDSMRVDVVGGTADKARNHEERGDLDLVFGEGYGPDGTRDPDFGAAINALQGYLNQAAADRGVADMQAMMGEPFAAAPKVDVTGLVRDALIEKMGGEAAAVTIPEQAEAEPARPSYTEALNEKSGGQPAPAGLPSPWQMTRDGGAPTTTPAAPSKQEALKAKLDSAKAAKVANDGWPTEQPIRNLGRDDNRFAVRGGHQITTPSGRRKAPAPKFNDATQLTRKRSLAEQEKWLRDEAIAEADAAPWGSMAKNALPFLRSMRPGNMSQADHHTVNDVLFGDYQGPTDAAPWTTDREPPKKRAKTEHPGLIIKSLQTGKETFLQPAGTVAPVRSKADLEVKLKGERGGRSALIEQMPTRADGKPRTAKEYEQQGWNAGLAGFTEADSPYLATSTADERWRKGVREGRAGNAAVDDLVASVRAERESAAPLPADGPPRADEARSEAAPNAEQPVDDAAARPDIAPEPETRAGATEEGAPGPGATDATRPQPAGYGSKNRLVSAERAAELRARLKAKLSAAQTNMGVDPELLALGTELAVFHLEAGARRFADWSKAVAADLDASLTRLKPYLRAWYTGAQAMMEDAGEDVSDMDGPGAVRAAVAMIPDLEAAPESGKEAGDAVPRPLPGSDAGAGSEALQPAPPERAAGLAPEAQRGRSQRPVRAADDRSGALPGRPGEGSAGPKDGRGSGARAADRISERGTGSGLAAGNYRIEPGGLAEKRGPKQKALDNLAAIETVKTLQREQRGATPAEQATLARYVGWGGIKGAFPDEDGRFAKGFEDVGARLAEALTPEEYLTARRSIQYAHYTSETIVREMWRAAQRLGFAGGHVFEPGMGTGNFAGMMPAGLDVSYVGIEMDGITAAIAAALYPRHGVSRADYTAYAIERDAFDLVIGNPPFSETIVKADPAYRAQGFVLHDFFFAKSLDAVRPGGLLMFVTSAGTMNKLDTKARDYLAARADLVGAIRLPGDAFLENAGTKVTTDIVILRKRVAGEPRPSWAADATWTETAEVRLPDKTGAIVEGRASRYFVDHPEMVLGEAGFFDPLYPKRYAVRAEKAGQPFEERLAAAIDSLPANILGQAEEARQDAVERDFTSDERKTGTYYLKDGALYQQIGAAGRKVQAKAKGAKGGLSEADQALIRALIPVRDALRDVYRHDLAGRAAEGDAARAELNRLYDAFVAARGPINKGVFTYRRPNRVQIESARRKAREEARARGSEWSDGTFDPAPLYDAGATVAQVAAARAEAREAYERAGLAWVEGSFDPDEVPDAVIEKRPNVDAFMEDPESYRLRSIEDYNDTTGEALKGPVFRENIVSRQARPRIDGPVDALPYVLSLRGRVDLDEIARLSGVGPADAQAALAGQIYRTPDGDWQTAAKYLSGNIREKLAEAERAAATDEALRDNVAALSAVLPPDLGTADVRATLGMNWIDADVVEDFGRTLGLSSLRVRYHAVLASWEVQGDRASASAILTWGTDRRSASELISDALNGKSPKIYDTFVDGDGTKRSVLNQEATQAAYDKLVSIKEQFQSWVWSDGDRATALLRRYNDTYNSHVAPTYDGAHLTTPGVSSHWSWRDHQRRGIARIVQEGNAYLAHAVGAGKTSTMIGAAMEMKRLGLVNKPMFVVPNHMLVQFTKEFYELYPTARIMVADEDRNFVTDKRKQFVSDAATSDVDAVIIKHSAFGLIPLSPAFQQQMMQETLEDLRQILGEVKKDRDARITRRKIEQQIEQAEQRLRAVTSRRTDKTFSFEEMGVDFLFVDEAHLFRKLDFATSRGEVKGIDPMGSVRSMDLFLKTRWLERKRPGRSHVLASGTPITNTMAELYTVSRYLQPGELARRGIDRFDAWASAFGDTVTDLEPTAAGTYKPVTRFSQFVNVPELSAMVRQIMDVVTPEQLAQYVTRPNVTYHQVVVPQTQGQAAYQGALAARMAAIEARTGPPKPGDDIMLTVINDGRNAAIDMRLVDPSAGEEASKLMSAIDNIFRIWRDTRNAAFHSIGDSGYSSEPASRGPATQMVFASRGVGADRAFNVHKFMVEELARRGVPRAEMVIFNSIKNDVAKQRVFNDMNSGKVRILFGSVEKMGTGVNAQRRLIANHNMDPEWLPSSDEQRNGRIIRQGNLNPEVEIYNYSTKGTYDAAMWGMMARKAKFIEGFFRGDPTLRDMEDLGEASKYEQAKALTTKDPRILELTEARQELEKEVRRRSAHSTDLATARREADTARRWARSRRAQLEDERADAAAAADISGENFSAKVGEATFDKRDAFQDALDGAMDGARGEGLRRLGRIGGFELAALDQEIREFTESGRQSTIRSVPVLLLNGGDKADPRYRELSRTNTAASAQAFLGKLPAIVAATEAEIVSLETRAAEFAAKVAQAGPYRGESKIDALQTTVNRITAELEAEHKASEAGAAGGQAIADVETEAEERAERPLPLVQPARRSATLGQARLVAGGLLGLPISNRETGLAATVSKSTLKKMTSSKAVNKSTNVADHALAIGNVDVLFRAAREVERRPDRDGEPTIVAIRRFAAMIDAGEGRLVRVGMLVKETAGHGQPNPLYTVEAVEVEPASVSETSASVRRRNAAPTGSDPDIGQRATDLNGTQDEAPAGWGAAEGNLDFRPEAPKTTLPPAATDGKDLRGALGWVAQHSESALHRDLAAALEPLAEGVELDVITSDNRQAIPMHPRLPEVTGITIHHAGEARVQLNAIHDQDGQSEETLLHEAIHAVIATRIGVLRNVRGGDLSSPLQLDVARLRALRDAALAAYRAEPEKAAWMVRFRLRLADEKLDEFLTYALTDPDVRAWLETVPEPTAAVPVKRRTLWQAMVDLVRRALGLPEKYQQPMMELMSRGGSLYDATAKVAGDVFNRLRTIEPTRPSGRLAEQLARSSTEMAAQVPQQGPHAFQDSDTERRFQAAAEGLGDGASMTARIRMNLARIRDGFTRHWIDLPNLPRFSALQQKLRALEAAPQAAKERTVRMLREVVDGFTKADLDLFTRKVILDDLAWEADQDRELPFGLTADTLRVEKAKVDGLVERNARVAAAVRRRKVINRSVARELVAAGVLEAERLKNPAYYRHVVLQYARAEALTAKGTGKKLRSPRWARRMGSSLDINANYLEAEFDWLQKALTDIPVARAIEWIGESEHNLLPKLRDQARAENKRNIAELIAADLKANGKNGDIVATDRDFRRAIAVGFKLIAEALDLGHVTPPDSLEASATAAAGGRGDPFPFLAWLLDNNEAGANGAAMVLKAISQRRVWHMQLLGRRFIDDRDAEVLVKKLAPEGYAVWSPDEGKLLFTVKTVPEHALDRMMERMDQAPGVSVAEVRALMESMRTALAFGGARYQMILPQEVAATLNQLRREDVEGLFEAVAAVPLRAWKRWVLINPRRVLKYNLNNLSGDLDAVVAGNPRMLRHVGRAGAELAKVMLGKAQPTARYEEAVERGVFDSGLSVQEIPDISALSAFEALTRPVSNRPDQVAMRAIGKVWRSLQGTTQWRENVFRYASYLDFAERLEGGEDQASVGYGASLPAMVDAVADRKDRAALLARDLIGDYGAISHDGAWLRSHLIPFWSWMEINTKRYWRLSANAWGQGVGSGLAVGGGLALAKGIRTTAWLGVRMAMLYGAITLWNALLFGDEEDELSDQQKRQLHLILGRDGAGEIVTLRLQGSLSDALSWFGLGDAAKAIENYELGRGDLWPAVAAAPKATINKIGTSLTPLIQIPFESATGEKLWPDLFATRFIRDRWRNLFSAFSLENEYDLIMDKPSRGYGRSWVDATVYRRSPEEIAYNDARGLAYDWLRRAKGQEGGGFSSPRADALYEWRASRRFGDEAAEERAIERLGELGVSRGDLAASIKRAAPLGPIPKKDRQAFLDQLTPAERQTFDRAQLFYEQRFLGAD